MVRCKVVVNSRTCAARAHQELEQAQCRAENELGHLKPRTFQITRGANCLLSNIVEPELPSARAWNLFHLQRGRSQATHSTGGHI
mmetsp:Transcript_6427/g.13090  ORF Transcript_6427/g.13090 Transcript_6427/m.13090 type:complete len:85 (-) Transcript_6427:163-417(-)